MPDVDGLVPELPLDPVALPEPMPVPELVPEPEPTVEPDPELLLDPDMPPDGLVVLEPLWLVAPELPLDPEGEVALGEDDPDEEPDDDCA